MAASLHAPDEILKAAESPLVFCPLGFERRAFMRFGKLPVVTTGPGPRAIARAFAERDRWPVRDPRMVVLLGLAGGIGDSRVSGQSVRVAAVVDREGSVLLDAPAIETGVRVVEVDSPVTSPSEKRALARRSGADICDLESRTFASCAHEAGLTWAIVRGISDDARSSLPVEAAEFIDGKGETRISSVLAALTRRPALLGELLRLARASRAAMREASFEADALGCLEGIDLCGPRTPLLVFGGSFDPPHARHATVLAEAMRALRAPSAMVIPAAINPLKSGTPPVEPEARLAMCRANFAAAAADFPSEVRLSRIEIDRPGPSYTIDTMRALLERRPRLAGCIRFLVGDDAIRRIESWHRWRELLAVATPAVVVRPPSTRAAVLEFLDRLAASTGVADAPSWLLEVPPVDLASTEIRAAIGRGERPAGLSDGVWSEIARRGLYGFGDTR